MEEVQSPSSRSADAAAAKPGPPRSERLVWWLFFASLAVYAASRLISIESFPIYFFCDEAVQVVDFRMLADRNFHCVDAPHELLPAYFRNGRFVNLSLSVYLQGLASYLGGQSVVTVRTTSALASLLGTAALALALRRGLRAREWWIAAAFLAAMPGLFLHSRTGFECVLMFSAYGGFLYYYLRYREENPRFIFAAMLLGAATFYSYSPGQGLMLFSGLFLAVSDFRYHRLNRSWAIGGLILGLLLFVPYLRYRFYHPQGFQTHLTELGSYWMLPLPLEMKLWKFVQAYARGFSPTYWFGAETREIPRHVVPFEAYIPWPMVPFMIAGQVLCLARWRSSAHRVVIGATLASAISGAFVAPAVTRNFAFFAVAALSATLGFDWLAGFVRSVPWNRLLRVSALALLSASSFLTLQESLAAGPTRFHDYLLFGMQWGAQAVFRDTLPRYLRSDPDANLIISHIWTNNPEVFPRFFGWFNHRRVYFAGLTNIVDGAILPKPRDLVLLTAEEYKSLPGQYVVEKFVVRETIPWPDGRIGFYLGHLYLRPEFVRVMRTTSRNAVRPEFIRLRVAGVPSSVNYEGGERGNEEDIFQSTTHPPLESLPGQGMRVHVFFDTPVALRAVIIHYTDSVRRQQRVVAELDEQTKVIKEDAASTESSAFAIPLHGAVVNRLHFDLRASEVDPVRLQFIEVVPESP